MAITLQTGARNALLDGLVDYGIAGGSETVDEHGSLEIRTSGGTPLAIIHFGPWGVASGGVKSSSSIPVIAAIATGTANNARIYNTSGSVMIIGLTVGTSASDVILDDLTITTGDFIYISSASITAPTS